MGFLEFALGCFDFLAWPILAFVYPLHASIKAIESGSKYHMRKLVIYWTLFSLISLFEHSFLKFIERVPQWPYIKLVTVCWLVIPRFNGSSYAYESLIRPCLDVNLQEVLNLFQYKPKKESPINKEAFLAMLERYVQENGSEALEKHLANKNDPKYKSEVEEIKTAISSRKTSTATYVQESVSEFDIPQKNIKAEPIQQYAEGSEKVESLGVGHPDIGATALKAEPAPALFEENIIPGIPASKKVQREWTCPLCQLTTNSEVNLNSHLSGRKHRSKCEELKSIIQTPRKMEHSSSTADKSNDTNREPGKCAVQRRDKQKRAKTPEGRIQDSVTSGQQKQKEVKNTGSNVQLPHLWCSICNINCTSESDMRAHITGRKHLSALGLI